MPNYLHTQTPEHRLRASSRNATGFHALASSRWPLRHLRLVSKNLHHDCISTSRHSTRTNEPPLLFTAAWHQKDSHLGASRNTQLNRQPWTRSTRNQGLASRPFVPAPHPDCGSDRRRGGSNQQRRRTRIEENKMHQSPAHSSKPRSARNRSTHPPRRLGTPIGKRLRPPKLEHDRIADYSHTYTPVLSNAVCVSS